MKSKEIIFHFKNVMDGSPWYGHSVMKVLNNIADPNPHVLSILQHMIAWRDLAIDRIRGVDRSIKIDTDEDWPQEKNFTLDDAIERLQSTNQDFILLLQDKEDDWFKLKMKQSGYTFQFLIEGIIQHDIYHLGQIAILGKEKK